MGSVRVEGFGSRASTEKPIIADDWRILRPEDVDSSKIPHYAD